MDVKKIALDLALKAVESTGRHGRAPLDPKRYEAGLASLEEGLTLLFSSLIAKDKDGIRRGGEQATVALEEILASYFEPPSEPF
ncbi:hypothetical protein [Treponema endosymbiont of Eucomonympha sp.]|uniref:hypothetical protein n=1 Tax=Treponema endosymbiont of Eucomonympha sp. TaxID=1580831 RepID=UPI000750C2CB|nr:hypothetical protein [Treponema endosymbiont of Eucomonympha sp.]